MPNDPIYDAVLERAKVHLAMAYQKFSADEAIQWRQMTGNAPLARERVWIDALRQSLEHQEKVEKALGG